MTRRTRGNSEDPAQGKIPSTPTLQGLAKIAENCKACDLWKRSTQTVFGEGKPDSKVMFVGEVPGDQEDRAGKPFVGPAGQLLDKALVHDFITQFHYWLDKPELRRQRLSDDPKNGSLNAYYHWRKRQVDFIYLDNSKDEGFDKDQLAWFEGVLKKDKTEQDVLAVVVGMHRALPNSFACGHSMNGDPGTSADANRSSLESGRSAYKYLLDFQSTTHKRVYVLASHSHFFMQDIFDTPYWNNSSEKDRGVLDGWLIGTAGAKRYRLPDSLPSATLAITYTYGYLLAKVHADGTVNFEFQQITEDDVPPDVGTRYGKKFVDVCFLANRDDTLHRPEVSCNDK